MPETTTNPFNKAFDNLQSLSRNWAILALTTSAKSLENAASFLTDLSTKLTVVEAPAADESEPAPEAEAKA